jgi:hypothetical protein
VSALIAVMIGAGAGLLARPARPEHVPGPELRRRSA